MSDGFFEDLPKVESFLREKHGLVRKEAEGEGRVVFEKQKDSEVANFISREAEIVGKGKDKAREFRAKNEAAADKTREAKRRF